MEYYREEVGAAFKELASNALGLSDIESAERLKQYGPNIIKVHTKPLWKVIFQPFMSVFMVVLFVAAGISFWENAVVDGLVILTVIAISAVMDYAQQYSTGRILRSLKKQELRYVTVLRKGKADTVETTQLVPGDVIQLEEGDKIPADCRVVTAENFRVDESQLTGESLPITKDGAVLAGDKELYEQSNMLFQGSFVVAGKATALVLATGNTTEFGRMAALSTEGFHKSPVEQKIDVIVGRIIIAVGLLAVAVFLLSVARGSSAMESLRFTIALAVSAVPEGLPVAISVVLATGMRILAKKRALVRHSAAMESIGVITTIATDKTGTLTKNQLTVQELWAPRGQERLLSSMHGATLNAQASKVYDPLDRALAAFTAHRPGTRHGTPFRTYAFQHETAMSGALYHYGSAFRLFVKGSPEAIMHHARLSENEHEKALAQLHHMTGLGFRVIAFAHAEPAKEPAALTGLHGKSALVFDGFVAIADALRREAKPAIMRAQAAGISVRMITGDHFETAFHIGRQLGLVNSRDQVFDTRGMNRLGDEQLAHRVQNTYVFSRVTPERKHRLLTVLKQNDITAMTGDGINDVPALTNAHVGIAMGSGSDIAKDAGDILLLNDNFRSIVDGVAVGRTIYANIRRMVTYLISTNLGEVFVSVFSLLAGMPMPLVPIQILWINLVTDTTTVIPLGLEPEHVNIMKSPPTPPKAPLLSRFVLGQIIVVAVSIATVTLLFFNTALAHNSLEYARTMAFYTLAVSQWGMALSLRATLSPVWTLLKTRNIAFYIGISISIALQIAAMVSPLAPFLHVVPLSAIDALVAGGIGFIVPLVLLETYKYFGRVSGAKV